MLGATLAYKKHLHKCACCGRYAANGMSAMKRGSAFLILVICMAGCVYQAKNGEIIGKVEFQVPTKIASNHIAILSIFITSPVVAGTLILPACVVRAAFLI